ncbi:hypothetical protein EAH72_33740 [Pseudomonas caspiana]|nr:hypothetical protein [Pseudomonas caspiana]TPG88090.1 hypothetical protein EAH72_33740 [Pseudomonas caspiana]
MAAKPLKHTDVALGNLMTYIACEEALEGMGMCASNVIGGSNAFFSGKQTVLTATAQKKYSAIKEKMQRMAERLSDDEESSMSDVPQLQQLLSPMAPNSDQREVPGIASMPPSPVELASTMTAERNALISALQKLHPELQWGEYPLGDYDQYAEIDAPDVLVCFSNEDVELDEGLVDPYSTLMGERCDPSHWGLSEHAAQLIQAHNKIFIAKYPNCDGPLHRES